MKKTRLRLPFLALLTSLLAPFSLPAQNAATRIVGRLIPAAGEIGFPVEVTVSLQDMESPYSRTASVRESAVFEIAGVPAGRYRVVVSADGRAPSWVDLETAKCRGDCVLTVQLGSPLGKARPARPESPTVDVKDLTVEFKVRRTLEQAEKEIRKNNFRSALAFLEQAVAIQPELPSAYSTMGQVLMKLKRADEAERAFGRALELVPELPAALKGIGYLYLTTGREEKAIAPLSRAAALNDHDCPVHAWLGEALYHAGRYREAEEPLKRAVELDRDFYRASYRLGYTYLQLERYSEALAYFRLFLKTNTRLDASKVRTIVAQLEGGMSGP